MGTVKPKYKRDVSLEIMRIFASFFVIFNHIGGYTLFSNYPTNSVQFWLYIPFGIFCKFAVPLFFMISGALLLGKDEDLKTIFKKRILKTVLTIFFISLLYYVIDNMKNPFSLENISEFIFLLFSGTIKLHMWFLYSYVIFLLILPFLRKVVKLMQAKDYGYMGILCLIAMIMSSLFYGGLLTHSKGLSTSVGVLSTNIIVFPCMGYYFYRVMDYSKVTKKKCIYLLMSTLAGILITAVMTCYRIDRDGVNTFSVDVFFNTFVLISSSTVFILIKFFVGKKTDFFERHTSLNSVISTLGECTFGIYLLHRICIENPYFGKIGTFFQKFCPPMVNEFIFCTIVFIVCLIVTFVLRKIPFVKQIL